MFVKAQLGTDLLVKLGLMKDPAEQERIKKRRGWAQTAQGLRTLFPESQATRPDVSLPLLESGMSANQIAELAQRLAPENPDELTGMISDVALRYAQGDPTLTERDKELAQGYLGKKFGTQAGESEVPISLERAAIAQAYAEAQKQGRTPTMAEIASKIKEGREGAGVPGADQEFNTVDELAIGYALGKVTPDEYTKALDALAKARKQVPPATGGGEGGLTANQALEQAEQVAIDRAKQVTQNPESYEPMIDQDQYEELGSTNPQEQARYFRVKDTDYYTAWKPEAKRQLDDANTVLTSPARKRSLADTIVTQQAPTVTPGAIPDIPIEKMLEELNRAGFEIDPKELQDPAARQQLRLEYRKWVSLGRPMRNASK